MKYVYPITPPNITINSKRNEIFVPHNLSKYSINSKRNEIFVLNNSSKHYD